MGFQRKIALLSVLLFSTAWTQDEPRFQTTANAADVITPIGGKGIFGVGFYTETMYPIGRPFASDTGNAGGGNEDMRFQVPLGFGLEGSYGIGKQMEVALSVGFDYFKTQNFRGSTGTPPRKIYDEAKFRLIPIMGIFRYRWPRKYWAPEVEAGLGAALGSIEVTAYTAPRETVKASGPFYRGHIAAGPGFSWGDGASLHFHLGYGVNMLGSKTYALSNNYSVSQDSMLSGVFAKAFVKFYF